MNSACKLLQNDLHTKAFQFQLVKSMTNSPRSKQIIANYVSKMMLERGNIRNDLLVIDNPADGRLLTTFKRTEKNKPLPNIVCTVKDEGHFQYIQNIMGSIPVYHYDLMAKHRRGSMSATAAIQKENEILSSAGEVSGVIVLSSCVSDIQRLESLGFLENRLRFMETGDGFQRLHRQDWFLLLPHSQRLSDQYPLVRCLNTYYNIWRCLKFADHDQVADIFYTDMEVEGKKNLQAGDRHRLKQKISEIQADSIQLVKFIPRLNLLKGMSLQEREEYRNFVKLMSGEQRLIPALEKVFPGCGLEMIERGYQMTTEISKIDHSHFIHVFKDVRGLKGYEESALHYLLSGKEMNKEEVTNINSLNAIWSRHNK